MSYHHRRDPPGHLGPGLGLGLRKRQGGASDKVPLPGQFLDFNPAGGGGVLGSSTFTRTTIGYYFNGSAYAQAAIDEARFQRFPSVGRHFLWEPAATNLLTQSSDYNDAAWTLQNLTATDLGVTSIGLRTHTLDAGTGTGSHRMFAESAPATAHSTWAIAKAGTGRYFVIRSNTNDATRVVFDLVDGVITQAGGSNTANGMLLLSDGYYLCIASSTSTSGGTATFAISNTGTPSSAAPSFTGNNETIDIAHVQLEGTIFPTSPIVTTGSTLTRTADSLSDIAWPATSSAIVDATIPNLITTQQNLLGFGVAASVFTVNGAATLNLINGGINSAITAGTSYESERHQFGMSLVTNEGIVVDDESNDNTDVTGTPGQGTIFIGSASDLTDQPSWIHRVRIANQTNDVATLEASM